MLNHSQPLLTKKWAKLKTVYHISPIFLMRGGNENKKTRLLVYEVTASTFFCWEDGVAFLESLLSNQTNDKNTNSKEVKPLLPSSCILFLSYQKYLSSLEQSSNARYLRPRCQIHSRNWPNDDHFMSLAFFECKNFTPALFMFQLPTKNILLFLFAFLYLTLVFSFSSWLCSNPIWILFWTLLYRAVLVFLCFRL